MIERGFAVVGSPATVRERLEALARRLGVGHLLTIMQFGSMPHDLAERNLRLMAAEVLPHLQTVWDAEGWEDRWWPSGAGRLEASGGCGMSPTVETVPLRHCGFEAKVRVAGSGPPVVYLHPAGGPGLGSDSSTRSPSVTPCTRPTTRAPGRPTAPRSTVSRRSGTSC